MRPCLPTRYFASTASNSALAPLCSESATHSSRPPPTSPSALQQHREPPQPRLAGHPHVPGRPSRLPTGDIQSPYVYRASGLAQIAVSTMLHTNSIGYREFLHAEQCRYGTRDSSSVDLDKLISSPAIPQGRKGIQLYPLAHLFGQRN
jgi:hypothetical protein